MKKISTCPVFSIPAFLVDFGADPVSEKRICEFISFLYFIEDVLFSKKKQYRHTCLPSFLWGNTQVTAG